MKYLLDTSALLSHHRKEKGWEKVHEIFESQDTTLLIASITIAEFSRRLLELGADGEEVTAVLQSYRLAFSKVVAIDEKIAWKAFEMGQACPARLPLVDALIAAAASAHDAILVHRDKHLVPLKPNLVKTLYLAG